MKRQAVIIAAVLILAAMAASTAWAWAGGVPISDPSEAGKPEHLVMMIVYATIALTFSFLCSVAEAVVLSVSPSYIATLENEGRPSAGPLKKVKSDIDRTLAAILTLNTIAHTVGAGGAGAEASAYFGGKYVGISMTVLTLLILFLSEIIPKTLGAVYWRQLAPVTARFVQFLTLCLYPLIWVSEQLTQLITRGKSVHGFNRDEFTALAEIGAEHGHLDPKESRIVKNLFRFPSLCVSDIMTPRTVAFTLQQDRTVHEVFQEYHDISFSRIPIFGDNRDEVTGFVLKTDLLLDQQRAEGKSKLRDLKREIRSVSENTTLMHVLEDLLDHRAHLMIVVDDYGGTQGLVTLEDVVETLIGIEIVDEADQIDDMRKLARQKWEERMRRAGVDVREPEAGPEDKGA